MPRRNRRPVIEADGRSFVIASARRRFGAVVIDFALLQVAAFLLAVGVAALGGERLVPYSPVAEPVTETLRETTRTLDDGMVATVRLHVRREDTNGKWPRAFLVESIATVDGDTVRVREVTAHPETLEPMGVIDSNDLAFLLLPLLFLVLDVSHRRLSPARNFLNLEVRSRNGEAASLRQRTIRGLIKALPFLLIALLIAVPALDAALRPWSFGLIVLPFLVFFTMLFDRHRSAVHDRLAGTVVVQPASALPGRFNRL